MKIILAVLITIGCSSNSFSQKITAIKCGQLLDTKTGTVLNNQTIIVSNNLIKSIGATKDVTAKADTTIDLSGYFVLPGLIDCHTHILLQGDITSEDYDVQLLKESVPYRTLRASRSCAIALNNGFTTLRDLGTEGAGYADVDVKKAIKNGIIPGPRLFVSTLAINTTGHYPIKESDYAWELKMPKGVQEITGVDEARKATREQITRGADWIKIYADRGYYRTNDTTYRSIPNFTTEEITTIGDETIRNRRKMAAHAMTRDGILAAINAGASTIEHGSGMDEECMDLMVKKNVFWCPTIFVNDFVADGRLKAGSPINAYFRETVPTMFKKALAKGVKIAYGTDIGGYDWNLPQTNDFSFMVQWGMTPLQAIKTATTTAAELLDQQGKIGEIKVGAFADIIAVKGDATKNIAVLNDVKFVMKDGVVYKSAKQ